MICYNQSKECIKISLGVANFGKPIQEEFLEYKIFASAQGIFIGAQMIIIGVIGGRKIAE